jgi:hypothetical protein
MGATIFLKEAVKARAKAKEIGKVKARKEI